MVATRNAALTLPRCLDSMRAQSFRDFEVIVMDCASSDGTVDVLKARPDLIKFWQSEPDSGIYNAWNKALDHAEGEWIAFLGADDCFADGGALERLAPHLKAAGPAHRVVYSRVRLVDATGAPLEEMGEPWERLKTAFQSGPCLPQPGLMHHRSLFARHGRFDERFTLAGDYELLLRELKDGDALFVPTVTVHMQQGGLTTDPGNFYTLQRETRQALVMHGRRPPAVSWAYHVSCAWLYARAHALLGERTARKLADLYRVMTLRKPRYSGRRD